MDTSIQKPTNSPSLPKEVVLSNPQNSQIKSIQWFIRAINERIWDAIVEMNLKRDEFLRIEEIAIACENVNDWGISPFSDLIRESGDVNEKDASGTSLLIAACCLPSASGDGYPEIVKLLLVHPHVLLNELDPMGFTPLMWAASYGYDEIIELLIKHPGMNLRVNDQWKKALQNKLTDETRILTEEAMKRQGIEV